MCGRCEAGGTQEMVPSLPVSTLHSPLIAPINSGGKGVS